MEAWWGQNRRQKVFNRGACHCDADARATVPLYAPINILVFNGVLWSLFADVGSL